MSPEEAKEWGLIDEIVESRAEGAMTEEVMPCAAAAGAAWAILTLCRIERWPRLDPMAGSIRPLSCDRTTGPIGPKGYVMANNSSGDSKNTLYCSFCGKSQHEVRKLIAGPTVFICDECVELCMDIIREENKTALV